MTELLFMNYLEEIVKKRTGAIFYPQTLLLMDQAASHKIEDAEKIRNTSSILIPAGCTPLVQPLDVSLNKPFKAEMRKLWKDWLQLPQEQHCHTKHGKRQRVSQHRDEFRTFVLYSRTVYHL